VTVSTALPQASHLLLFLHSTMLSKVLVAYLAMASATEQIPSEADMQQMGELGYALQQKMKGLTAHYHAKERRLQAAACWEDCPNYTKPTDNHTVCKATHTKPMCEAMTPFFSDACLEDCTRTKMEAQIMCESKQFCVDMKKEGACPTTLGLVQGSADYPNAGPCSACTEFSTKATPIMMAAGMGTMNMDVSKMTMGMVTDDNCPTTIAGAQCAMDNADPCLDPTKSTDGGMMFFAGLCECPCGKKMAKMLWDLDALTMNACKKGLKDKFKTAAPGMADMGPIVFSSGVLECFGCPDSGKACSAAFKKWILDPNLAALMDGLMAMKGKCDVVTTPTTTPTTTTTTEVAPATSFALRGATPILGSIAALFAAIKLA